MHFSATRAVTGQRTGGIPPVLASIPSVHLAQNPSVSSENGCETANSKDLEFSCHHDDHILLRASHPMASWL